MVAPHFWIWFNWLHYFQIGSSSRSIELEFLLNYHFFQIGFMCVNHDLSFCNIWGEYFSANKVFERKSTVLEFLDLKQVRQLSIYIEVFQLHRCWWRILETKCVGDMLVTDSGCWWPIKYIEKITNITKKVANMTSLTSLSQKITDEITIKIEIINPRIMQFSTMTY